MCNQRMDYLYRDSLLGNVSLYDFVSRYHKVTRKSLSESAAEVAFGFVSPHPQSKSHALVLRVNFLTPIIIGSSFVKETSNPEKYAFMFLSLFKPFFRVEDLLSSPNSTWADSLRFWDWTLLPTDDQERLQRFKNNIHEITSGRSQQKTEQLARSDMRSAQGLDLLDDRVARSDPFDGSFAPAPDDTYPVMPPSIVIALPTATSASPLGAYCADAVLRRYPGPPIATSSNLTQDGFMSAGNAAHSELSSAAFMKSTTREIARQQATSEKPHEESTTSVPSNLPSLQDIATKFELNPLQTVSFMEVGNSILANLSIPEADQRNQLGMFTGGPGDTGKTRVIHAIQHLFEILIKTDWLRTAAWTGSAAHNVNGRTIAATIHSPKTAKSKRKDGSEPLLLPPSKVAALKSKLGSCRYMIIDEISMFSAAELLKIDARLRQSKDLNTHLPFGGVNMIFFGDSPFPLTHRDPLAPSCHPLVAVLCG